MEEPAPMQRTRFCALRAQLPEGEATEMSQTPEEVSHVAFSTVVFRRMFCRVISWLALRHWDHAKVTYDIEPLSPSLMSCTDMSCREQVILFR